MMLPQADVGHVHWWHMPSAWHVAGPQPLGLLLGNYSLIVLLRWVGKHLWVLSFSSWKTWDKRDPECSREFLVEYLSWPLLFHLTDGTGSCPREPRLTWFLV